MRKKYKSIFKGLLKKHIGSSIERNYKINKWFDLKDAKLLFEFEKKREEGLIEHYQKVFNQKIK